MFERFTRRARQTVITAQDEARRLRHRQIGSEHLLLALTLDEEGAAARSVLAELGLTHESAEGQLLRIRGSEALDAEALSSVGIDLEEIRRRVETQFGPGALDEPTPPIRRRLPRLSQIGGGIPFGDDAKLSLEIALREAIRLHDGDIRSAHILLGLLRASGLGVRIIEAAGVQPGLLRSRLALRMRTSA